MEETSTRIKALRNYHEGQESIANGNVLSAIAYYKAALHYLREIAPAEATEQDTADIRITLSALIHALNKLIQSSAVWAKVADELHKFLMFYLRSVEVLNETTQRLPGLDELVLADVIALRDKSPSRRQGERINVYLAVVSLFHEDLEPERNFKIVWNKEPAVIKAFALYQHALMLVPAPAIPPVVVPASAPAKAVFFPPQGHAVPPKVSRYRGQFDNLAPDDEKREGIRRLMETGDYQTVIKAHGYIRDPIAIDFQRVAECYFKKGQFSETIECYRHALTAPTALNKPEVFKCLVDAVNEMTKNWSANFVLASTCTMDFLTMYVDYFGKLNSDEREPLGLDGITMEPLLAFLQTIPDERASEIMRIYLAVIGMFRKDLKREVGEWVSDIEEMKIKQEGWGHEAVFILFQKALVLVQGIKGHAVLNPNLKLVAEPEQKRWKGESSSSSSLPRYRGGM